MARYFQAPVIQPANYGYDAPFQELYGAIKMEQGMQDENVADAQGLYDVGEINALQQDYGVRDRILNTRYENVDKMLYDDSGNVKDVRHAQGSIQAEARRRAREDQAGGEAYSVRASYQGYSDYVSGLDKQHTKGDIGQERRDELQSKSFREYTGIGEKSANGAYNIFSGVTAVHEVEDQKVADAYATQVAFQKLQSSGIFGADGKFIGTQAAIDQALKDPMFRDMGDFIQTGTVEFRTLELINRVTANKLMTDQKFLEDVRQEADLKGLDFAEFAQQRIDELSYNSALTFASGKFSPQIRDDWRAKKRADLANGKALIDYEKTDKMETLEFTTNANKGNLDPGNIRTTLAANGNAITAMESKIAELSDKAGNPRADLNDSQRGLYDGYKAKLNGMRMKRGSLQNQQNQIYAKLTAAGKLDLKGQIADDLLELGYTDDPKFREAIVNYFSSYNDETLNKKINNGTLYSDANFTKFINGFEANLERGRFGGWGAGHAADWIQLKQGKLKPTQLGDSIQRTVESEASAEDLSYDYTINARTSSTTGKDGGTLGRLNKDATTAAKSGTPFLDAEGNVTDVNKFADEIRTSYAANSKYVKSVQLMNMYDGGGTNKFNDESFGVVGSFKVTLKDGTTEIIQREWYTQPGTQSTSSYKARKVENAYVDVRAATATYSETGSIDDLQRGHYDLADAYFSGSGLNRAEALDAGDPPILVTNKAGDAPAFYVRKVGNVFEAVRVDGYSTRNGVQYNDPQWGDFGTGNMITDVREYGTPGAKQFTSINALKETLGVIIYKNDINKRRNKSSLK